MNNSGGKRNFSRYKHIQISFYVSNEFHVAKLAIA